ncbi:glycosyltransferase family 9 protein [Sphingomonas sp.]|uniref:glycosyltransferase family 9 protein n=1 Tax=Sphingomonas sp. TaxID=28214 RepID=UPI003B3B1C82
MNDSATGLQSAQALAAEAQRLRAERRWSEALDLSVAAAEAAPGDPAILQDLALLLTKLGRLEEGEAVHRQALTLVPNSALLLYSLAHNLLAQGRYREAWPLHAARVDVPGLNHGFPRGFPFPRWQGEPLDGKRIAVFPEQGQGDQIQLARFLPRLIGLGGRVTLLSPPSLVALFDYNFANIEVVAAEGQTEFPDPDYWITLYDLPAIFGATLAELPSAPYLTPPSRLPKESGFRIGLRDRGNPNHINDMFRSLPPDMARRLRDELPGAVVDLDPDVSGARDFAETAAILSSLDLVVSVDTAVAHLAGALGLPCLLLLSGFSPDWRWMFGRDDSPWYPRHRLYRGAIDGTWDAAVDRVIADARAFADTNGGEAPSALPSDTPPPKHTPAP